MVGWLTGRRTLLVASLPAKPLRSSSFSRFRFQALLIFPSHSRIMFRVSGGTTAALPVPAGTRQTLGVRFAASTERYRCSVSRYSCQIEINNELVCMDACMYVCTRARQRGDRANEPRHRATIYPGSYLDHGADEQT